MKNILGKSIKLACCLLALGMVSIGSNTYADSSQMRDVLTQIKSGQQASALKPGSTFAMTCAKCKTVVLQKVDQKKGFLSWFAPKTKHACPGCGGTIVTTSVAGGKASITQVKHTCSKCGDNSAFCCGSMGDMKM